jgi:hypothetical protein
VVAAVPVQVRAQVAAELTVVRMGLVAEVLMIPHTVDLLVEAAMALLGWLLLRSFHNEILSYFQRCRYQCCSLGW